MSEETVQLVVMPEDGLCEGCGQPIGDEVFETDDMVTVCRACWDECVVETVRESEQFLP